MKAPNAMPHMKIIGSWMYTGLGNWKKAYPTIAKGIAQKLLASLFRD
jgi:hypothetical protein